MEPALPIKNLVYPAVSSMVGSPHTTLKRSGTGTDSSENRNQFYTPTNCLPDDACQVYSATGGSYNNARNIGRAHFEHPTRYSTSQKPNQVSSHWPNGGEGDHQSTICVPTTNSLGSASCQQEKQSETVGQANGSRPTSVKDTQNDFSLTNIAAYNDNQLTNPASVPSTNSDQCSLSRPVMSQSLATNSGGATANVSVDNSAEKQVFVVQKLPPFGKTFRSSAEQSTQPQVNSTESSSKQSTSYQFDLSDISYESFSFLSSILASEPGILNDDSTDAVPGCADCPIDVDSNDQDDISKNRPVEESQQLTQVTNDSTNFELNQNCTYMTNTVMAHQNASNENANSYYNRHSTSEYKYLHPLQYDYPYTFDGNYLHCAYAGSVQSGASGAPKNTTVYDTRTSVPNSSYGMSMTPSGGVVRYGVNRDYGYYPPPLMRPHHSYHVFQETKPSDFYSSNASDANLMYTCLSDGVTPQKDRPYHNTCTSIASQTAVSFSSDNTSNGIAPHSSDNASENSSLEKTNEVNCGSPSVLRSSSNVPAMTLSAAPVAPNMESEMFGSCNKRARLDGYIQDNSTSSFRESLRYNLPSNEVPKIYQELNPGSHSLAAHEPSCAYNRFAATNNDEFSHFTKIPRYMGYNENYPYHSAFPNSQTFYSADTYSSHSPSSSSVMPSYSTYGRDYSLFGYPSFGQLPRVISNSSQSHYCPVWYQRPEASGSNAVSETAATHHLPRQGKPATLGAPVSESASDNSFSQSLKNVGNFSAGQTITNTSVQEMLRKRCQSVFGQKAKPPNLQQNHSACVSVTSVNDCPQPNVGFHYHPELTKPQVSSRMPLMIASVCRSVNTINSEVDIEKSETAMDLTVKCAPRKNVKRKRAVNKAVTFMDAAALSPVQVVRKAFVTLPNTTKPVTTTASTSYSSETPLSNELNIRAATLNSDDSATASLTTEPPFLRVCGESIADSVVSTTEEVNASGHVAEQDRQQSLQMLSAAARNISSSDNEPIIPPFGTKKIDAREHKPRHYEMDQLQIGNYVVKSRITPHGKMVNKFKVLFTKRRFVYQLEKWECHQPNSNAEPNAEGEEVVENTNDKMACIIIPFSIVRAIRCDANFLQLLVANQPLMFLGKRHRRIGVISSGINYDYSNTVDLTNGQIKKCPIHTIILRKQQADKLKVHLWNFDIRFQSLTQVAFPFSMKVPENYVLPVTDKDAIFPPIPKKVLSPRVKRPRASKSRWISFLWPQTAVVTNGGTGSGVATKKPFPVATVSSSSCTVCSCRISCRSVRCSCAKVLKRCGSGGGKCLCSSCDNPLNILENVGVDSEAATSDLCLVQNIYKHIDLRQVLFKTIRRPCCRRSILLKDCIPGTKPCSSRDCEGQLQYSWCQGCLYDVRFIERNHCNVCVKCQVNTEIHCQNCNKCYSILKYGDKCPRCKTSFNSSVELEASLASPMIQPSTGDPQPANSPETTTSNPDPVVLQEAEKQISEENSPANSEVTISDLPLVLSEESQGSSQQT